MLHGPQSPPQPSSPHCPSSQLGVHAGDVSGVLGPDGAEASSPASDPTVPTTQGEAPSPVVSPETPAPQPPAITAADRITHTR